VRKMDSLALVETPLRMEREFESAIHDVTARKLEGYSRLGLEEPKLRGDD